MSSPTSPGTGERPTPSRGPGPAAGPGIGRGPAAFMGGPSVEKSLDFRGSSRRLFQMLRPERPLIVVTMVLATVSVTLSVLGPKILGRATDLIFSGVDRKSVV